MGSFGLGLSGDSEILPLVAEEMAPLAGPGRTDVRVVLTSSPAGDPPPEATIVGDVAATADRAWIRCSPTSWTLVVDRSGEVPLATIHAPAAATGLKAAARRARNRSFLAAPGQDAYLFIHFILEFLVLLFSEEVALVHSSAISRGDKALMLVSTGGTGKTSGAGELIARHGWSFLSDDITPVTADGFVISWPRRVMVYPYNLTESPVARKRVLGGRGPLDRLQWEAARVLLGPKGPRRRVDADQLYDSVGTGAQVQWAIFLSRWRGTEFRVEPTDPQTLAERSRHILATEFGAPLRWLHEWSATGHAPIAPAPLLDRQRDLTARALETATSHQDLRIPQLCSPAELAAHLDSMCDGASR